MRNYERAEAIVKRWERRYSETAMRLLCADWMYHERLVHSVQRKWKTGVTSRDGRQVGVSNRDMKRV